MNKRELIIRFLTLINILLTFVFFFNQSSFLWIIVAIQCSILLYFFNFNFPVFLQSCFWPVFLVSLIAFPWPFCFIIPIVLYLILLFLFKKFKYGTAWLRFGRINKITVYLMVPTIIISSAALICWVIILKPDLTDLYNMVPSGSIMEIVIVGLIFSIFNSIWEEIILKGILWNTLENIISNVLLINLFQAVLFGIMHLNGFPRGITGAIMAGFYGLFIGFIRKSSGGLMAPVITHFFADATIFVILAVIKF